MTLHHHPKSTIQSTTKCSTRAGGNGAPQSLLDLVINKGKLKEREARPLAQQLARTLSLLHMHGVVHRSTDPSLSFAHQYTN